MDVRDKLVKLLDVRQSWAQNRPRSSLSGDKTFDRAFESAQDRGVDNMWLTRLKRFRSELEVTTFLADLGKMSPEQKDKCLYEVGKIQQSIERVNRQVGR